LVERDGRDEMNWGEAAEKMRELIGCEVANAMDLVKWDGTNHFARVCGQNHAAPVAMAPGNDGCLSHGRRKPTFASAAMRSGAGDALAPSHGATVTRLIPTNSRSCSSVPSISRHSSMALRMRSVTSSSDRACVWRAGSREARLRSSLPNRAQSRHRTDVALDVSSLAVVEGLWSRRKLTIRKRRLEGCLWGNLPAEDLWSELSLRTAGEAASAA
jgi:hypothetical protein